MELQVMPFFSVSLYFQSTHLIFPKHMLFKSWIWGTAAISTCLCDPCSTWFQMPPLYTGIKTQGIITIFVVCYWPVFFAKLEQWGCFQQYSVFLIPAVCYTIPHIVLYQLSNPLFSISFPPILFLFVWSKVTKELWNLRNTQMSSELTHILETAYFEDNTCH